MRRAFFVVTLAGQIIFGSVALPGSAQEPIPQEQTKKPPIERQGPTRSGDDDVVKITTNLVQIDAVITDKNGKIVNDLRADEVQISEDGQQQKVTHFSFVSSEAPAAAETPRATPVNKNAPPVPPTKLHPEDVKRTIALVVDDLGLSFVSTNYVRRALKKFVDEQMQPGDLVAIIRTSGGIGALQQFTADKRQLYAAIERVKWQLNGRSSIGAFAPIEDTSQQNDRQQKFNEDFNQFREEVFAVGTLGAVSYVVKGMHELPGRKSILLISDGFRIYSRDDPDRNYRTLLALRRLIDQANRATVVIHTMNAMGLQTLSLTAADSTGEMNPDQVEQQLTNRRVTAFEVQEGLDYLAQETGASPFATPTISAAGFVASWRIKRLLPDRLSAGRFYF